MCFIQIILTMVYIGAETYIYSTQHSSLLFLKVKFPSDVTRA